MFLKFPLVIFNYCNFNVFFKDYSFENKGSEKGVFTVMPGLEELF